MTELAAGPVRTRPRARGWIHLYSAIVATLTSLVMIPIAALRVGVGAALACSIYALTLIGLFTVSATYHRHTWTSTRARTWMKRADHSMIFVFIAGSYTPLAALALHPPTSTVVLIVVWVGAAGGVALKMLWPNAPRWLGVPFYLALGWVAVFVLKDILASGGVAVLVLIACTAMATRPTKASSPTSNSFKFCVAKVSGGGPARAEIGSWPITSCQRSTAQRLCSVS